MAEAIAEIEGMDSVSRAGPNLHCGEDWMYPLQDTPLKRLMEPDPQMQIGEWLLHSGELQDTEDQFYRRTQEPEIERLRDIRGEPEKRADHGRRTAMERSQVMAKSQETGRREARSRSISHRRNLSASWDCDSPPPPLPTITQEEKVQPKDIGLHAVACSKVVTNPRTWSTSRKVKEVMTQGETQEVARSPSRRRVKANLKEYYTPPQHPVVPPEPPHIPLPTNEVAKDRGTMARVANPYSENEYSDNEDQDYTIVGSREGGSSF